MSIEANHEQEPRIKGLRMRNAVWGVSKRHSPVRAFHGT